MTLKSEANVLLLDEPTNDIDVNTLRALEEGLENFAGCAVIITHDRWFLDRVATHILAFEGDSQVYFFEGGYTDYEANKKTPGRSRSQKNQVPQAQSRLSFGMTPIQQNDSDTTQDASKYYFQAEVNFINYRRS